LNHEENMRGSHGLITPIGARDTKNEIQERPWPVHLIEERSSKLRNQPVVTTVNERRGSYSSLANLDPNVSSPILARRELGRAAIAK
jgi:hypothetical protein